MPKDLTDDPSEGRPAGGKKTVRSTKEIKAGMLRRAFDGQSKYTSTEVISMILEATHRSKEIPEEHVTALQEIDSTQPRSVMMLNTMARHLGNNERYTDTTNKNLFMGPSTMQ